LIEVDNLSILPLNVNGKPCPTTPIPITVQAELGTGQQSLSQPLTADSLRVIAKPSGNDWLAMEFALRYVDGPSATMVIGDAKGGHFFPDLCSHMSHAIAGVTRYPPGKRGRESFNVLCRYVVPDWKNPLSFVVLQREQAVQLSLGPFLRKEPWTQDHSTIAAFFQSVVNAIAKAVAKVERVLVVPYSDALCPEPVGHWASHVVLVFGCMTDEYIPGHSLCSSVSKSRSQARGRLSYYDPSTLSPTRRASPPATHS
jgi:hypothetical protein